MILDLKCSCGCEMKLETTYLSDSREFLAFWERSHKDCPKIDHNAMAGGPALKTTSYGPIYGPKGSPDFFNFPNGQDR